MEPALGKACQAAGRLRARPSRGQSQGQAKSQQSREHNKKIHDHKYPAGVKRSHRFRRRLPLPMALILSTQLLLLVASTFDLICSFSARTQLTTRTGCAVFCDLCLYSNASLISIHLPGLPPVAVVVAGIVSMLVALFIFVFASCFCFCFCISKPLSRERAEPNTLRTDCQK